MRKLLCLFALTAAACLSPAGALAQTKFSGAFVVRPDEWHMLAVGDREGHALGVAQGKCDWIKPLDFGGDEAKDGVWTETLDVDRRSSSLRGVLVVTTLAGDRVSLNYRGTGESKRVGEPSHVKGTFTLAEGAGKLKNATGTGTFSCTSAPERTVCDIKGKYKAGT